MADEATQNAVEEAVEEDVVDESTADDVQEEPDPAGAEALGDPGKKALDAMKAKVKERGERIAALQRELDEAKGVDEATKAAREAESAALARANDRIKKSEIKAAAKGILADPADAFKFLDLDDIEVDDDGNVDEDAIASAIADLVKQKPYLAAQGERRFRGGSDGGARKESRPKQWTRADLAGKTPQQIADAKAKGQLADLLNSPKN